MINTEKNYLEKSGLEKVTVFIPFVLKLKSWEKQWDPNPFSYKFFGPYFWIRCWGFQNLKEAET